MNVAYCVICHRNNKVLRTTVNILSNDNDVFLHVDKKSNIDDFSEYKNKVHFIENRIDVKWGGYSQIECMLALLEGTSNGKYDYVCLLSGDDLPLKNSDEIKKFFNENKGTEFIGVQSDFDKNYLKNRVRYKHTNLYLKRNKNIFERVICKIQNRIMPLRINKYYKLLPELYKGSNWFCISNELCDYILNFLEKNPWYKKAFKKSFCGDEVFFQTIVMNSKFKDRVYKNSPEYNTNHMTLRYIDWKSGPEYPKILSENDFIRIKNIKNNDYIFARKFNENISIEKYMKEFNMECIS